MKKNIFIAAFLVIISSFGCKSGNQSNEDQKMNIIFLHHSTGSGVWRGATNKYIAKLTGKGDVEKFIAEHNKNNNTSYSITEQHFPKSEPYGWKNYPFDYYNIWVKNAGDTPYMDEPTLEMLTKQYDVIIFKHCFPVSGIQPDIDSADIDSETKTIGNYKLQYQAIKEKLKEFPDTKFILWTGAALTKANTNEEEAQRAKEFFTWVKSEWDEADDNIFLWDFYDIETEGGMYLKDEFAVIPTDSHPNPQFNGVAANLFVKRIIDVIETNGKGTNLKGEEVK